MALKMRMMKTMTSLFSRPKKILDKERNILRIVSKEEFAEVDTKILTTQEIISEYIDWNSLQSFQDFSKKNEIKFIPGDFCIQLSEKTIIKLRNDGRIDLSEVEKIGWFGKEKHNEKWNSFKTLNNFVAIEIKNSIENLEICNFSQFKRNIINVAETDSLKGGLGLAFFYNQKEYQNFLSKISWRDNQWRISSEDLEPEFTIPIFLQLVLFQSNRDGKFFVEISKSVDKKFQDYFFLLNEIMIITLNYLTSNSYQGKNHYLNYLIKSLKDVEVDTDKLKKKTSDLIFELEGMRLVHNEGAIYKPESRLSEIVNDFINLSDVSTEKLKDTLDNTTRNYSVTVYFLLGMMHLYSRTQKQFYIKSLIHYIISVTSYKVSDIEYGDNFISLIFNISKDDSIWSDQFKFIKEHFDIIKEINGFSSDSAELKKRYQERKNQLSPELKKLEDDIIAIKQDIRDRIITKSQEEEKLNKIIDEIISLYEEKKQIKESSSLDNKKHYLSFKSEFTKTQDWQKFQTDFKRLPKVEFEQFISNLEQDEEIRDFNSFELQKNVTGDFFLKSKENKEYIISVCIDNWNNKNEELFPEEDQKRDRFTNESISDSNL